MRLALIVFMCSIGQGAIASDVFATVGDVTISRAEYEAHVEAGLRQRFYHGKIPELQLQAFREEMAVELIDRELLVQEARHRGILPRADQVNENLEQTLAGVRAKGEYNYDDGVAQLRSALERHDLIEQLRKNVIGAVKAPDDADVLEYYRAHPDKFTTPERLRLSLIMLAVEPWAPTAKWQAAKQEADNLVQQLRAQKATFSALAKLHSSDASASLGGDLGFVHSGMLAPEVQQHVEALAMGDVSEPLRLLQGIAILRLDGRESAQLNAYSQVKTRASGLLLRQMQQQAWAQLVDGLRQQIHVQRYETVDGNG